MNNTQADVLSAIKNNDRYFLSLFAAFILGLLLLFHKDLNPWIQTKFVPSFVVYLIGSALIGQIQQMVGMREELKCRAESKSFIGSPKWFFRGVIVVHIFWFSGWVTYLVIHLTSS